MLKPVLVYSIYGVLRDEVCDLVHSDHGAGILIINEFCIFALGREWRSF